MSLVGGLGLRWYASTQTVLCQAFLVLFLHMQYVLNSLPRRPECTYSRTYYIVLWIVLDSGIEHGRADTFIYAIRHVVVVEIGAGGLLWLVSRVLGFRIHIAYHKAFTHMN